MTDYSKKGTPVSPEKRYARLQRAFSELQRAAQKVVDETEKNLKDPWPIKYRAPYGALVELRTLLGKQRGLR